MTNITTPEQEAEARRLEEQAAASLRAREESFERCDTDGFLSQWAHGLCADRDRLQAQIVRQGDLSEFPALFDLDGKLVAAKLVHVRSRFHHGTDTMWGLLQTDDPHGQIVGWVKAFPARQSTLERKGYREGRVMAPAKADLRGDKNVAAVIVRTDGGFSRNVQITDNGKD